MITIESFVFNPFEENTYVVYNEDGMCMIVDPGCYDRREEQILSDLIKLKGLKPTLLVNTHCHIDHVFGNDFVARTYGLKLIIPKGEEVVLRSAVRVAEMYGLNYSPVTEVHFFDTKEIALGKENFKIIEVPGHSPGHVAFYHSAQGLLLGGDVLFRESIGRTDLPGGDMNQLLKSIKNNLFTLPDETVIYPGHMGITTVAHEKVHNPFLN